MLGIPIVLLAAVCFCGHNVIVRVLFHQYDILGLGPTGGFVAPTLQNSFLLMVMRMVVVVPLMAGLASTLYASTWTEMRQLRQLEQRRSLYLTVAAGGLMFLYLVLLYVSIGLIPTGIALTLFFTYPLFTALLSWRLWGQRPTLWGWGLMGLVLLGSILAVPHTPVDEGGYSIVGVGLGLASGLVYALYTVVAQICFQSLHLVPFTWASFAITLGLSAVSLLGWPDRIAPLAWTPLWIGAVFSAIATLSGHLLYNYGI